MVKKEILVSCTISDNQERIISYFLPEHRTGPCVKKVTRFRCLGYICVERVTICLVDVFDYQQCSATHNTHGLLENVGREEGEEVDGPYSKRQQERKTIN